MTVRVVEGKKPYTGGTAIEITEDKVINLLLREANNLLQVNGNNELFCDLQLNDELRPTDDFPVGVTTGRIVEDNGWDWEGTILCAKTTSGDNIKLVYTDEGEIWVDNGTGTFKKMYLASEVDTIIENLTTFKPFLEDFVTDGTTQQFMTSVLNSDVKVGDVFLGQVSLSDMPSGISVEAEVEVYVYPSNGVTNILYCMMRSADVSPYLWQCNSYQYRGWEAIGGGGGGGSYTAGEGINIDSSDVISNTLPGAVVNSTAPSSPSQGDLWYDTTNDVLKSYDGTNWNAIGVESNTKTFYLSSTSDLTNAQAAYDWYAAGKNPVLFFSNKSYILSGISNCTNLLFAPVKPETSNSSSYSYLKLSGILFSASSGTVTAVNTTSLTIIDSTFLRPSYNYSTPYTPEYDGSPATKKYVDDRTATIDSTAPSNPVTGKLRYDTTNSVLKIYDGTTQTWIEIGGSSPTPPTPTPRTPGADTVGYYPLTSTSQGTDQSGNGRDFTANGSVTYGTYGGVDCCYINQGQLNYTFLNSGDWLPSSGDYTISLWYYHVANPSQDNGHMAQFSYGSDMGDTRVGMDIPVTRPSYVSDKPGLSIITDAGSTFSSPAISLTQNAWHHCVVTKNGSTLTLYVNGVSSASTTYGGSGDLGTYGISRAAAYIRSIIGGVSQAIFEKKCWTSSEVADYFNNTKADYGIS